MTIRPVRRSLVASLVAAALGVAGVLTAATPAQAVTRCQLTFRALAWPTLDGSARWQIEAKVTNTATVASTDWRTGIRFPATATVAQWWNVTRMSTTSFLYWRAAGWNKVVAPGGSTTFGFEIRTPDWETSPLPTSSACAMYP